MRKNERGTYMLAAFLGVVSGYYTFQPELEEYWRDKQEEQMQSERSQKS